MGIDTVAITGASGLIGTELTRSLQQDGITVRPMVRRAARTPQEIPWQPGERLDPAVLEGVDAVVHLAGAGVGEHRWTESYKKQILDSRVAGTTTIARAIAEMPAPPGVLVSASAIGFYGDRGAEVVDEESAAGGGFLADVVRDWEAAAAPAVTAGIRVVHPRTGLVFSSKGGALQRMIPLFKAGVGGTLGSGKQYWSWISMHDEISALRYLLVEDLAGPVNLTAAAAATNSEVTKAMGSVLGRPTMLPVPKFALRIALGEFSSDVLSSARVRPTRLIDAGFTWRDEDVADAIRAAVAGE